MLAKIYNTGSPDSGRVPIWTHLITEIIYYAGYRQLESKYFYNKICKCMNDMYEMHDSNYVNVTELC